MSTVAPESTQAVLRDVCSGRRFGQSIRAKGTFEVIVTAMEKWSDALTVALAIAASYRICVTIGFGRHIHYPTARLTASAVLFAGILVGLFAMDGGYQRGHSLLRIRETERILRATVGAFAIAFAASLLVEQSIPGAFLGISMLVVPNCLLAEKQLVYALLRRVRTSARSTRQVIIYGAGQTGRRVFSALVRSPRLALNPTAIIDDDVHVAGTWVREFGYRSAKAIRVQHGPLTPRMIHDCGAEMIIVAIPSLSEAEFEDILAVGAQAGVEVAFTPRLSPNSDVVTCHADIDGVLLSSLGFPVSKSGYDIAKRILDVMLSGTILILSSPLWLVPALLIRMQSPGPVFFSQDRVGKNGVPFRIYKFRTMYIDAPKYAPHPNCKTDHRITPIGRWLRRTSLDELPQLVNVLKGEMSLVGPRPEMPFIVETYEDRHWQRLQVLPGITGIWQLSGDRALPIHHNIQYDLYYIRHRNLVMDLAILLHTLVFAMRGL